MVTLALTIAIASVVALYLDAAASLDTSGRRTEVDASTGTTYIEWREIEARLRADKISVSVCANGARLAHYPIPFRSDAPYGASFVPSSVRSRAELVRWVVENCWPDRSIEWTAWHAAPKRSSIGSSILRLRGAILEIFYGFYGKVVVNRAIWV